MAIVVIVSGRQKKRRQFVLGASEWGVALDMAYAILEVEPDIISVILKDENISIKLPLSIFNGQSFEAYVNQLKGEWEQLLSQPFPNMLSQVELQIKIIQSRINQEDVYIAFLETAIVRLELLYYKHEKDSISIRYKQLIDEYRRLLTKTNDRKEINSEKLRVLLS